MAHTLRRTLIAERGEDGKFPRLWQKIIEIAQSLSIEPSKKRTVRRQQNCSNPPVNDIEAHYRVAYYYAHTINHLNTRLIATHLFPANIANLSSENISKIRDEFEDVLPQPSELQNEVTTWKVDIGELDLSDDEKKSLLFTCTFAANNNIYYSNIYTILSRLLTHPVGSCSCERSLSSLRRLKTWCRNTTTNEKLDALAIGYINPLYAIDAKMRH